MDWSRSYTARWRLYRVDPDTWGDAEQLEEMKSAKVDSSTDKQEVQSGTIEAIVGMDSDVVDKYYRIVLEAEQDGSAERVEIATLFCTSESSTYQNRARKSSMTCSSTLYPATVKTVPDGTFLAAGDDAVAFSVQLLQTCLSAPVTGYGRFALNGHVVFGGGATVLGVVSQILSVGGYRLRITGSGNVEVRKANDQPSVTIAEAGAAFLHDGIRASDNMAKIPNRVIAVKDGNRAEVTNDRRDSRVSTVRRGYDHEQYDANPQLVDGETLIGYAERRLEELSVLTEQRSYKREYMPDVSVGDLVLTGLQRVELEGAFRSVRQSVTCGTKVSVEETIQREESLWHP